MRGIGRTRTGDRRTVIGVSVAALAAAAVVVPLGATAVAKPTGPPVKVMVIYEKSAGVASPEIPDGVRAAAKALNKKNGINGSPVQVLVCDTNNDPNVAAECGRKAVDQKVVALVGVLTPHSASFMPLMEQNKIPSIGVVAAGASDFTSPAAFPISGGLPATSGDLPRFLADDGAKKVSIARIDLAQAAIIPNFAKTTLAKVNQQLVNDVPVPQDAPDMSSYVQAALANGTDGIVVALAGQDAVNFVQAAKQADPKVKLAVISTEPGAFQKALGGQAAGIIEGLSILPPLSVKSAQGTRFLNEMKAAGFKDTSGFRLNSWLSMQVLADVAKGLPQPLTSAAVFDKLGSTTGLQTGLTPPLQWTTPADVGLPLPRVFTGCELAVKIAKGAKVKPVTGKFYDAFAAQTCPLS
jgi:ABC-type branched-subunit amino acid transport system substrate-binding protein